MPHNRIRLWVGLAIIAVTIPVAAQYLGRSRADDGRAGGALRASRWSAGGGPSETRAGMRLANDEPNRDYLAEVKAAMGRRGTVFAGGKATDYDNGPDWAYDSGPAAPEYPAADYSDLQDEMFDLNPLDGPVSTDDRRLPDPAALVAPDPATVAPPPADGPQDDADTYAGGLSDGAIYATVVNNLPADDRDEFVRAWAAMTPDQRAEMLDQWRGNLQGDGDGRP